MLPLFPPPASEEDGVSQDTVDNPMRSVHSTLSEGYPLEYRREFRVHTKPILSSAMRSQNKFQDTSDVSYFSNAADLRALTELTPEGLRRSCVPLSFCDEGHFDTPYVSGQIAAMWLLINPIPLTMGAHSSCLLPMYKRRIQTVSDPTYSTNLRLVCMPPGTGKTAVVIGACEALMKGPARVAILDEADTWAKQLRTTSRTGNFTSHGSTDGFARRSMAVVVAPDNVYTYWHGMLRAMIDRAVACGSDWSLFPNETSSKVAERNLVAAVDRATVESGSCVFVLLTPDQFKKFLLIEQHWVWPVTIFDEISAHFRKMSNTLMPLCKELWGMTATPTDLSDMMPNVAKTNPIRMFLGDDYQQCKPLVRGMERYPTEGTKALIANLNVMLMLALPSEINQWISDQMSDLMFAGVACIVNPGCGFGTVVRSSSKAIVGFTEISSGSSPPTSFSDECYFTWKMWEGADFSEFGSTYRGTWEMENVQRIFAGSSPTSKKQGFVGTFVMTLRLRKRRVDQAAPTVVRILCDWFSGPTASLTSLPFLSKSVDRAIDVTDTYLRRLQQEQSSFVTGPNKNRCTDDHLEIKRMDAELRDRRRYIRMVEEKVTLAMSGERSGAGGIFAFDPLDMRWTNEEEVLLCARCACCFSLESLFVTGWWVENLRTEKSFLDASSERICGATVRCPNCYVWLQLHKDTFDACNGRLEELRAEHTAGLDARYERIELLRNASLADQAIIAQTHFPYPQLPCGVAYALDFALRDAVLRHGMRRIVVFCEPDRFLARVTPVLEEVARWPILKRSDPAIGIVHRSLLNGTRTALKAMKGENIRWFSDATRLDEVRVLHLNNKHTGDKEETHGMNLAITDMIIFVDSTPNSVQAVSRGLRAGKQRKDDKWLVVYRV